MSFPKLSWGREKHDLADRWPKGPDGTPEKPAFLADSTEEDNAAGMTVEMLRAYDIPVMKSTTTRTARSARSCSARRAAAWGCMYPKVCSRTRGIFSRPWRNQPGMRRNRNGLSQGI